MKKRSLLLTCAIALAGIAAQAEIITYKCTSATSTIEATGDTTQFPAKLTSLKIGGQEITPSQASFMRDGSFVVTVSGFVQGQDLRFTLGKMEGDTYYIGSSYTAYPLPCQIQRTSNSQPTKPLF